MARKPTALKHKAGDKYVVIGYYYNTAIKFRRVYGSPHMAMNINLWNGRVWRVRDGKRTCIKTVTN